MSFWFSVPPVTSPAFEFKDRGRVSWGVFSRDGGVRKTLPPPRHHVNTPHRDPPGGPNLQLGGFALSIPYPAVSFLSFTRGGG